MGNYKDCNCQPNVNGPLSIEEVREIGSRYHVREIIKNAQIQKELLTETKDISDEIAEFIVENKGKYIASYE